MSLDAATRAQTRAADPAFSAWVTANAGSGKTRVLTNRVARLLLAGAEPSRILGLTYTRAAAAEMQNRLFATLGEWAMMEDEKLRDALAGLSERAETYSDDDLARARTLFARALETPGGLKIQTIHAFCAALLRRFPLEAGVSPRFEELDDRGRAQMIEAIRDRMAGRAETGADPAFDAVADHVTEETLDGLIEAILANRGAFGAGSEEAIREKLDVGPGDDSASVDAAEAGRLSAAELEGLAAALDRGGKDDGKAAALLRDAIAALKADDSAGALDAHAASFLKKDGDGRSTTKFPSKAAKEADPTLFDAVEAEIARAVAIRERRLAIRAAERALALDRFGAALLAAYDAEKARRGVLDYDDLITRARALLTTSEMAAWALYKLDGGIDHVLVDEAQDTSPDQWEVIRAIAAEFFAGEGARPHPRTIFAVGDEKQSIYSFQGADPQAFGEMRKHFTERLSELGSELRQGELTHCFRSAPPILALVDKVFEGERAEGLSSDGAAPAHLAFHEDAPGLVELWPFVGKAEGAEESEWWRPVDTPPADDPKAVLAEAVAEEIARMVAEGAPLPVRKPKGEWRATRPGDILVLVRRRDALARGIIRRLKGLGVPVAGQDRLSLTDSLAVKDLLALLRVAEEPGDDLSLAAILRSPLGGVSEEALFDLAASRDGRLHDALMARRDDFPAPADLISDLRNRVDFLRPYELLERALTVHGGRKRLVARLGHEAEDPIDELLAQALAYERAEPPSLTGFLAWIDAADDMEIKREMQAGADEVRVMTVHGAKGLESPVVILPDTGPRGVNRRGRHVLRLGDDGPPAWSSAKADAPEAVRAALDDLDRREAEEERRLLYVALTRAESRLIVAGAGDQTKSDSSWYGMVAAGFEAAGATAHPAPDGLDGEALALAHNWSPPAELAAPAPEAPALAEAPAPTPVPPAASPRRVTVTDLAEAGAAPGGAEAGAPADRARARLIGDATHLLLETRAEGEAALRLLAAALPALAEDDRTTCVAAAEAARALPEAAPFFGAEALVEAGISFTLPDGARAAGRVDRLLILPDRVRVLDVKTGAAPDGPEGAPEAYLRQMALYQDALRRLHPGLPVEAFLLWTAVPRLDLLPDSALDAALDRALAGETRSA